MRSCTFSSARSRLICSTTKRSEQLKVICPIPPLVRRSTAWTPIWVGRALLNTSLVDRGSCSLRSRCCSRATDWRGDIERLYSKGEPRFSCVDCGSFPCRPVPANMPGTELLWTLSHDPDAQTYQGSGVNMNRRDSVK